MTVSNSRSILFVEKNTAAVSGPWRAERVAGADCGGRARPGRTDGWARRLVVFHAASTHHRRLDDETFPRRHSTDESPVDLTRPTYRPVPTKLDRRGSDLHQCHAAMQAARRGRLDHRRESLMLLLLHAGTKRQHIYVDHADVKRIEYRVQVM